MSTTSAARMQRLLAMVPWIVAQDGPTLDEVCARFDLSPEELADDLDVVWLVGVPPYTPDALIDVVQEGDRVWIHFADVFDTPQRLTPDQAVALLTAGASVLALPGADDRGGPGHGGGQAGRGARRRRGDRCSTSTSVSEGPRSSTSCERGRPSIAGCTSTTTPTAATPARSATSTPTWCTPRTAASTSSATATWPGGERRFRVDRIAAATLLDDTFDPPADAPEADVFRPDVDDPRVVLDLAPAAAWVAEAYPVESVEERPDGGLRVQLAVGGRGLARAAARQPRPAGQRGRRPRGARDAGRRAAARILDRYR